MLENVGAFSTVPRDDLISRTDKLRNFLADTGISFGLIIQNVDRFYFTGTMQKGIVVIPVDGNPLVFIEKGIERAAAETPFDLIPVKSDREIRNILLDRNILAGKAGLELDVLPVAVFERFQRTIGFDEYADISEQIKTVRMIKSEYELRQLRRSGEMLSHVFARARNEIYEGRTELEIEAVLVAEGRKLGHQGFLRMRGLNQEMMTMTVQAGFTGAVTTFLDAPITGVGVTPAIPQGSSFKHVERGIPITIDYGGGYNGYITDETRTFVVGELGHIFKKPYETVRAIIDDMMKFARPGVNCTDIFLRAREIAQKEGLADYFMGYGEGQVAFIGHGIGLEINELPILTARHDRVLEQGMVFAFEPKFVLPDKGAVGIEIDCIVTHDGLERITSDSTDIVNL
ncbi:MAG: xaa-pro aminopeptidase [Deltaproteobacteria bacterium]|nr:xaa-pro aminopeptidase [Deltaproteobacteria bacterium]